MKKLTRVRARNCSASTSAFPAGKMFPPEVFSFYVNILYGEAWVFGRGGSRKVLKKMHNRKSRHYMNDERNF